jgi:hypothetical protein
MLNRRTLIKSSGLALAGAAGAAVVGDKVLSPSTLQAQTAQLNTAVLNSVQTSLSSTMPRFANKAQTTSDIATLANQIQSLINEFNRVDFDYAFKTAANSVSYTNGAFEEGPVADMVYGFITPYVPSYPFSNVNTVFASMSQYNPKLPSNVLQGLAEAMIGSLAHNGATIWLVQAQSMVNSWDTGGGELPDSFCAELNLFLYFLGGVATILAVMCVLPEPAIVVICPAVAAIAIIIGILAIIAGIIC